MNVGAVENEASGTAVTRKGKAVFGDKINHAGDVFDLARSGDEQALKIVDDMAYDLAMMFCAIGHIIDPHVFVVAAAVGLHPQCVHGRALALVQHPALQIGSICRQTHHLRPAPSTSRTSRALGSAADAGVTGHIADASRLMVRRPFLRQHSSCVGGFDARMASADEMTS